MRKILKGRLTLAVLFSLLLLVSGTSAVVYANGEPPIIDSGKEAATEQRFHLTSLIHFWEDQGTIQVDDESSWIWGNLMTFTHPGTPNSAAVGDLSYSNRVGNRGRGRISGSFTINVGYDYPGSPPGYDPPFIYGPIYGTVSVSFDARSRFVPKLDEQWEPDHYNFQGFFNITSGTGFYEGITGSGTIGGTFHDHTWSSEGLPTEKWFDFVMIGQAAFPDW